MFARLGLERISRSTFQFFLVRGQAPVAAGVRVETPTPLRDLHRRPAALVGGVGQGLDPRSVDGVDDAVLAGGAHVVPGPGQRRGDPDQPAGRVRDDLHVHAVALVLPGVERAVPTTGHADAVDAQQGAVEDDVCLTAGHLIACSSVGARAANNSSASNR